MRALSKALGATLVVATLAAPASVKEDIEASERAQAYWRTHLSKCGTTYVARSWYADRSGGEIIQLSRVQYTFDGRRLTEADGLNGVEWDGVAYVTGESRRTRHFSVDPRQRRDSGAALPPVPWTAWEPSKKPVWLLHLRKTAGRWQVSPVPDNQLLRDFEPWTCADAVPSASPKAIP